MERLTIKSDNDWHLLKGFEDRTMTIEAEQDVIAAIDAVIEKCAAFEERGLTPDEIAALQVKYTLLQKVVFNLATRNGGVPCEWCKYRDGEPEGGCRACQDAGFEMFEFGGLGDGEE